MHLACCLTGGIVVDTSDTVVCCRCKPKKCRQECKKSCPVVKVGEQYRKTLCTDSPPLAP